MNRKIIGTAAVMGVLLSLSAADVFAGRGNGAGSGGGKGLRDGSCVNTTGTATNATRPAGSQRRDGTFLTTGVTANGSTTRPANGKGLQNGSRLATTPTTSAPAAQ